MNSISFVHDMRSKDYSLSLVTGATFVIITIYFLTSHLNKIESVIKVNQSSRIIVVHQEAKSHYVNNFTNDMGSKAYDGLGCDCLR